MRQSNWPDRNDKILRRFYEPLVLLGVLDPTRGAQHPDLITDQGLSEGSKLWHNSLDQLSWLCDSDTGGDTVTSIAAENLPEKSCFWVASNSMSRYKAKDHLVYLLERLHHLCTVDVEYVAQVRSDIFARCIDFSSKRIKTYTRRLLQTIEQAEAVKRKGNCEDEILSTTLIELRKSAADPAKLCTYSYNARRSEALQILGRRHNSDTSRGVWSDLRHYIGRLGCWNKALCKIEACTREFPQRIFDAQVLVIEPGRVADRPSIQHSTGTERLIYRMFSDHQRHLVEQLHQALQELNTVTDIESRFREIYSSLRPRPHAELLVLEHFYGSRLEFVGNDKYIGCSKPSCYCCHLYMQLHRGNFVPRPCHGNLWINWAPPIPLPDLQSQQTQGTRPQQHHTFQMLQNMIPKIRQDLEDQILSRRPKRSKMPDSTTGMSSVMIATREHTRIPQEIQVVARLDFMVDPSIDRARNQQGVTGQSNWNNENHRKRLSGTRPQTSELEEHMFELSLVESDSSTPNLSLGSLSIEEQESEDDEDFVLFKGRRSR